MNEALAIGGLSLMLAGVETQSMFLRVAQVIGGIGWIVAGLVSA